MSDTDLGGDPEGNDPAATRPARSARRNHLATFGLLVTLVAGGLGCAPPPVAAPRDAERREDLSLDAAPEAAIADVIASEPSLDAPSPDVIEVGSADAPPKDATDVLLFDGADAADVVGPDVADAGAPDVTRDVGTAPDAGGVGPPRFDAPEEWTRLPISYGIAEDLDGDGRRDALLVNPFDPAGMLRYTFALAQPDGDFLPGPSFAVRGTSASLRYGDFDGDRRTDVLVRVASATLPNTYIFRALAGATFAPAEPLPFTGDLVADFDQDGRSDVLEAPPFSTAVLHLRQASGAFVDQRLTMTLTNASVGDFDGDGARDLASGTMVYRGLGGGRFSAALPATCAGCPAPTRTLVARVDGDTRDDLIVATDEQVVVLLGQSNGALARISSVAIHRPVQLTADDLDGDGRTDLLVVAEVISVTSSDMLQLLYGDGAGGFPDRRNYRNTRSTIPAPVVVDADRDGRKDVVLDGRFVAYGRGSRRIRAPELSTFTAESTSSNHAIVALDGPGLLDLVVARPTAEVPRWRFQPDRQLSPAPTCTGPGSGVYRGFRDLTGDGRPDALLYRSGVLSIWVGMGGCAFSAEHRTSLAMGWSAYVRADGDALPDLIFSTPGGLAVALATAPGDFGPPVVSPFRGEVSYLAAGDWNRDRSVDALVIDNTAHAVTVFDGNPARQLLARQVIATPGARLWSPLAGDADGDGDLDVLAVNNAAGQLEIFRNDGAGTFVRESLTAVDPVMDVALADLDGDGRVEVLTSDNQRSMSVFRVDARGATRLVRVWIPRGASPYDVDGDGDLDLVDVQSNSALGFVAVTNNRQIDGP